MPTRQAKPVCLPDAARAIVAVAVIRCQGRYLLARRLLDSHQGGKLEFVGGKIDAFETPSQALAREVREEVGLDILDAPKRLLGRVDHDYGDKSVRIWAYAVELDDRFAHALAWRYGRQRQRLYWLQAEQMGDLAEQMPAANRQILAWLENMEDA